MEVTTEENNTAKEERIKLYLKETEKYFKHLLKNSPPELMETIQNSFDQFNTLVLGPEQKPFPERLEELNTVVNKISDKIKTQKNLNEKIKKYMSDIKKLMYKLNSLENKPSYIKKTYVNGKYEGDYLNGKRDGKGIYLYQSGDKYEGEYKNDLKDGFGVYHYANGDVYEGFYKEGLFDGKGVYKYAAS